MSRPGIQWLLDHGGPVVRYRTARELLEDPTLSGELERDLLASPLCRTWLDRLPRQMPDPARDALGFSVIHGAADDKLETSLGKLAFLGFHRGLEPFDRRCGALIRWLEKSLALGTGHADFSIALVGSLLALTGHADIEPVAEAMTLRRDTIYGFVRERRFDIYVPWPNGPPRFAKGRPLIDPRLYRDGGFPLPWHHDLHLFGALPERQRNADGKIRRIVDYVLDARFSSLLPEYGLIARGARRYMVSGWRPRLPMPGDDGSAALLPSLLMMAPFSAARRGDRFRACLEYLDRYRDGDVYDLPKTLIRERSPGYWPCNRMRLEERRTRIAHELESTFWVLKIRKAADLL